MPRRTVALVALSAFGALALAACASTRRHNAARASTVLQSELTGISCSERTTCVAVGYASDPRGPLRPLAEVLAAGRWRERPVPLGGTYGQLEAVTCRAPSWCEAVGGSSAGTLIEHWNGSVWQRAPTATSDGTLAGVACPTRQRCVAVGFTHLEYPLVEMWDGRAWRATSVPRPGGAQGLLEAVACPTARACVAVGMWWSGSTAHALIERWNGQRWRLVNASGAQSLRALSCPQPGWCLALGSGAGGAPRAIVLSGGAARARSTAALGATAELTALSCRVRGVCLVVGARDGRRLLARWRFGRWHLLSGARGHGERGASGGVSCASAARCKTVGYVASTRAGGRAVAFAAPVPGGL